MGSLRIRDLIWPVYVFIQNRFIAAPVSDACTHILLDDVRDDFPQGRVGIKTCSGV